jgi:transcriptional regulator with XRE-family HTH domain
MEPHEIIRKRRESLNIKQYELAEKLGLPSNTYNGYETGNGKIDAILLRDIASILKCSSDFLRPKTSACEYIDLSERFKISHNSLMALSE